MRRLFSEYEESWPPARSDYLELLLHEFYVLRLPEDIKLIRFAPMNRTIIVIDKVFESFNPIDYFVMGFEHVLYSQRPDFISELFSSCLMSLRPRSFSNNPIPFFFNGFIPKNLNPKTNHNLLLPFTNSQEKPDLIRQLDLFLSQEKQLKGIQDICLQAAEELLMNSLYQAPTNRLGERIYSQTDRSTTVENPRNSISRLFACYSSNKVVIGCEDNFGSAERSPVLKRLSEIYPEEQSSPLTSGATGGMGLKFIIGNSANFYMFCDRKKKTLAACSFLLEGKLRNTGTSKHLHISIR